MSLDKLPPFAASALLLDFDGTLVDLAPTAGRRGGGAGPARHAAPLRDRSGRRPGRHHRPPGGNRRCPARRRALRGGRRTWRRGAPRPGRGADPPSPALAPARLAGSSGAPGAAHPGVLLERKARGFALHFRAAPEAGPALRDALTALLAGSAAFELLPAHMLWEVRPRGVDKGKAVQPLMAARAIRRPQAGVHRRRRDRRGRDRAPRVRWAALGSRWPMRSARLPACERGCMARRPRGTGRRSDRGK